MDDLPNRLVMLLLLLVVVSTIITTIAFFQIEKKFSMAQIRADASSNKGRVGINIVNPEYDQPKEMSSSEGRLSIKIEKGE